MWPLIGVGVIAAGFLLRLNPLLAVALAARPAGLAAGKAPLEVIALFGKAFNDNRFVSLIWLVLPVIGLLERYGLQAWAKRFVAGVRGATTGRLLLGYFILRQGAAALGLTALGGQAQMVRPLIAPMAEAAAEQATGSADDQVRDLAKAHAAAADNVAVFFGEDIFVAFGSVLLIEGVLAGAGYKIAPLDISLWAIPTAVLALVIHGARLLRLDGRLKRLAAKGAP
jgi:uncharacterized membrane protein